MSRHVVHAQRLHQASDAVDGRGRRAVEPGRRRRGRHARLVQAQLLRDGPDVRDGARAPHLPSTLDSQGIQ